MDDLNNNDFLENKWLRTNEVQVRQVLSITLMLCLAGIFLTLVFTKLLETGLGWSTEVLSGQLDDSSPDSDVWKVRLMAGLNQILVFLLPSLATLYILRNAAPDVPRRVSLRVFPPVTTLGWSIALLAASMPLVFSTYEINKWLPIPAELQTTAEQANKAIKALMRMPDGWAFLANLTLIAIVPALGEELLFRGIIQNQLMRRLAPITAVVVSGAIFSLLHFQMDGFLPRWLLGVILGWVYWQTGNFWIPVLLHFLNNGIQVVAQFLYGQDMSSVDLAENDMHVPVGVALASLAATLWIGRMIWNQQQPAVENNNADD